LPAGSEQNSLAPVKLIPEPVRDASHQVLGDVVQLASNPDHGAANTWVVRLANL